MKIISWIFTVWAIICVWSWCCCTCLCWSWMSRSPRWFWALSRMLISWMAWSHIFVLILTLEIHNFNWSIWGQVSFNPLGKLLWLLLLWPRILRNRWVDQTARFPLSRWDSCCRLSSMGSWHFCTTIGTITNRFERWRISYLRLLMILNFITEQILEKSGKFIDSKKREIREKL